MAGLLLAGTAWASLAPDVVVLCDLPLRGALLEAGRVWRARNHVPVRVLGAPVVQNAKLVRRGARADILVGIGAEQMETARYLDAIEPGTLTVLGRNPVILAVRGLVAHPAALVPGTGLGDLLGDGRFGLVDPAIGRAGSDARASLTAVGLWPALEPRSLGAENTETLAGWLNDGSVRVAALYRSDLAAHPGLSVAATLPGAAPAVLGAMTKDVRSSHAHDFIAFLLGDDGSAILRRAGWDAP